MTFDLIPQALAADAAVPAAGAQSSILSMLPMMVMFFAVFYFLLLRPQQKRAKTHKKMMADLSLGDEIVTAGGILGQINKISDDFITMTIAEGVEMKMQKSSITSVVPKGTFKALD